MTVSTSLTEVTVVGIGAIGLPMAVRLARAGHRVTAVDPSCHQRELARAEGITTARSVGAVSPSATVIVMVATPEQLTSALTGGDGLFTRMRPGSVCIVMSTVGPTVVTALAGQAHACGIALIDAPVTGGIPRAEQGALTIFAAGPHDLIAESSPVFEAMGTVHRCGERPGDGQSYKLINQLLCSVHLVAAAEALAFAEHLGLDPHDVHRAVGGGAGSSWMLLDRGPRMLTDHDSETRTALDIFVKDSDLVRSAAAHSGFDLPLLDVANTAFHRAADLGLGRHDDSRIKDAYR
ncbi:NAD(P)-dependent oxidoreductase [Rhodococcus sp. NPDC057014]|uniref:NAD(P)-dependent oxidoreductase n=1 Tax=Rhodococcus sp. NPDC057014 TaxID=3346000 RepID=UPI00363E5497